MLNKYKIPVFNPFPFVLFLSFMALSTDVLHIGHWAWVGHEMNENNMIKREMSNFLRMLIGYKDKILSGM
jgi:hypothetical protein